MERQRLAVKTSIIRSAEPRFCARETASGSSLRTSLSRRGANLVRELAAALEPQVEVRRTARRRLRPRAAPAPGRARRGCGPHRCRAPLNRATSPGTSAASSCSLAPLHDERAGVGVDTHSLKRGAPVFCTLPTIPRRGLRNVSPSGFRDAARTRPRRAGARREWPSCCWLDARPASRAEPTAARSPPRRNRRGPGQQPSAYGVSAAQRAEILTSSIALSRGEPAEREDVGGDDPCQACVQVAEVVDR